MDSTLCDHPGHKISMNTFGKQLALTSTSADPRTGSAILFAIGERSLRATLLGDEPGALARDLSMSARRRAIRSCDTHYHGVPRHA